MGLIVGDGGREDGAYIYVFVYVATIEVEYYVRSMIITDVIEAHISYVR